jgi:hypothetical protein
VRALRNTDALGADGDLALAGWSVCLNGIATEAEEVLEEGRLLRRTTVYTNGAKRIVELRNASLIYRNIWREGTYAQGDVVTWGGSAWHSQESGNTDKPGGGSPKWRLMVKEGARGKDGAPPADSGPAPIVRTK